ncbi:MAG: rod shape-determining protein MreD [Ignavibacteriales bacterium]|nr:hypothetical protein [Ignavibacteriaceae bacterium]MBW7874214.1 rod shape-determining protein MreD [Ignavibacteria bacterium]MBZ0195854.1 rod shape-determining protein MreD [Ignavibacteriaceae bacterium]MCZ2142314.1 rod shape-determining protein MreD [Ignavibacteriales bacterium]WKZ73476.1 MAG: rod shape-determining protein MreD [Ignavibacteriaceae bacterium]
MNKKYSNHLFAILIFILLLILQVIFVPFIAIENAVPDLVVILIVYYSLKEGQINGMIFGFATGLVFDLVSGSLLGSAALAKTLAGFVAGFFSSKRVDIYLNTFRFIFIVLLTAFVNSSTFALVTNFDLNNNLVNLIFEQGITPALYTGLVSAIWFYAMPQKKGEFLK